MNFRLVALLLSSIALFKTYILASNNDRNNALLDPLKTHVFDTPLNRHDRTNILSRETGATETQVHGKILFPEVAFNSPNRKRNIMERTDGKLERRSPKKPIGQLNKSVQEAIKRFPIPRPGRVRKNEAKIRKALSDRPLPKGHYGKISSPRASTRANVSKAFYRIWPEIAMEAHPKLNALTKDLGGYHFALVVGTVDGFDIDAVMGQMLFKTLQVTAPNGQGQRVFSDVRPYNPRPDEGSYMEFIGEVPSIDEAAFKERGKASQLAILRVVVAARG